MMNHEALHEAVRSLTEEDELGRTFMEVLEDEVVSGVEGDLSRDLRQQLNYYGLPDHAQLDEFTHQMWDMCVDQLEMGHEHQFSRQIVVESDS